MQIQNAAITGSFTYNGVDISSITGSTSNITSLNAITASIFSTTASLNTASGSAITRLSALEVTSGSNITRLSALETASGSAITRLGALEVTSGSNITRLSSLEARTGSYATTGSNTFVGGQYLSSSFNPTGFSTTASLYTDGGLRVTKDAYISGTLYLNNVTVYGTQSVCYITSSQLNIASNLITVNTATPSVQFGGLAVYDSGSTGLTGSILWDSTNNHWIYSNPSGSSYSGGMFISGPRTLTLGSETGTTSCMLLAGQGGDHLTSSMIYHSSTVTCIPNTLIGSTVNVGTITSVCGVISGTPANSSSLLLENFNGDQTATTLRLKSGRSDVFYHMQAFSGNTTEVFRIESSGRVVSAAGACFAGAVCVGTNLVVRSAATFCDTVGLFGGSSQLYIGATSNASDFAILSWCATNKSLNIQNQSVGSGPQLIVACNGKVGVAVSDPIVQFHVRTTVASGNRPTNLATSATNSAVYFTTIGGSSAGIAFGQIGANTNYIQATYENGSASTPLSLNPYDGNTGIGITSPQAKLDVLSTLNIQASSNSDVPYINFSNNGRSFNWGRVGGLLQGDGDGALYFSTKLGGDVTEKLRITSAGVACFANAVCTTTLRAKAVDISAGSCASFTFGVDQQSTFAFGSTNGRRVAIIRDSTCADNGLQFGYDVVDKTGIIAGSATAAGVGIDFYTYNGSTWANRMRITKDGDVGIGTPSPMGPLEVYKSNSGGLGGHIILNNNGNANFNETGIIFNDSGIGSTVVTRAAITSMVCGEPYNGDIRFKTGLGVYSCLLTRMIINGNGNVGINNTVPKHNLEVGNVASNSVTNTGGFAFCNMYSGNGVWQTFACVATDANVVTQVTFTNTNDYNRSGVFVARWAYNAACAALHIVSCLWSNSQNVNLDMRNNSGALQICVSGGGGDYRVQAFIQGAKATG